jgi:hypothetical protein
MTQVTIHFEEASKKLKIKDFGIYELFVCDGRVGMRLPGPFKVVIWFNATPYDGFGFDYLDSVYHRDAVPLPPGSKIEIEP